MSSLFEVLFPSLERGPLSMGLDFGVALILIFGLATFNHPATAKRGMAWVVIGLLAATIFAYLLLEGRFIWVAVVLLVFTFLSLIWSYRVKMTQMPEMVAILNGFGGLSSMLVDLSIFHSFGGMYQQTYVENVEIVLGVLIGAVTFSGSMVAFAKLAGFIPARPMGFPKRHVINLLLVLIWLVLSLLFIFNSPLLSAGVAVWGSVVVSMVFGLLLILAIGGADMPVVIAMLNAYSGLSVSLTGFLYESDLLVMSGALVGSSGAILSYVMCKAMNRPFVNVIMGGFGEIPAAAAAIEGTYQSANPAEVSEILKNSKKVMFVPGYGMAVSQAQHVVREIYEKLLKNGTEVVFAVHPVAGRMPGHMNVLLAEARVPYDAVLEMDEVNPIMDQFDCAIVVGANDTVNPDAKEREGSPISGMPVVEVWRAGQVIVSKRSMSSGYSGVPNPLFYRENTKMLFGDSKKALEDVSAALSSGN